jgi:heat shock protein HtpX
MHLYDFEGLVGRQGLDIDMNTLLIYAAVIGFSGAIIPLVRSKWTAKRMTGSSYHVTSN